jgi:two-component system nitrogen regulation response regulator GlnG
VGGRAPLTANVRIIAATHRDLRASVRQGLFREDLFYRLNVVPLRIPPLRERSEDIPELVAHFLAQAADDALPSKSIEPQAIERLQRYRWPGNVRELENLILRLAALYSQQVIDVRMIETELADTSMMGQPDDAGDSQTLGDSVEHHLRTFISAASGGLPEPGLYARALREFEKPLIRLTLEATGGNQIKAAALLGVNRNTLRKKIRELDIEVVRSVK